jgi:putative 4-mercaptohistidine N1-methyltranferase
MSDIYETDKLLAEYLLFHFGTADEILPPDESWPAGMTDALDFPVRTVSHFPADPVSRGLDLGCAVGRSTFEMAKTCGDVVGIDFSHAFIRAANALRDGASIPYERLEEASVRTKLLARIPEDSPRSNITFLQGDAMHLPDSLGVFDRVHAANLICRLPEPQRLLDRLPSLVVPGGELVLATPCTWLAEFTPPENWPTGHTFDWLVSRLAPDFVLTEKSSEPFLIRETARKFQWTRSLVTRWRRSSP